MKKLKTATILNICIVILEVFAVAWMMSGRNSGLLLASRLRALRYFTVDSNILMGIFALIAAVDQRKVLKGEKEGVSTSTYILKLTGTVGVTLTMLVTIFFLAPTMAPTYGFLALFTYSNFFLHLLNPILSILCFLCFEKTDRITFRHTVTGIVPMLLYAVYYVGAAVSHSENGVVAKGYDWYGFLAAGVRSAFVVLPLLILITWGISAVLWKLNRRNG